MEVPASAPIPRSKLQPADWAVMLAPALLGLLLHLIAVNHFGYFRDELYYLACSDHLAFGYVDQPPLSILLLKGVRLLLGDSLAALRLVPILCGTGLILLTGRLAREFGGGRFAVLLASLAALAPIGNFFTLHAYSMNALDLLFWTGCLLIVTRIIREERPRLWLLFGLAAGIGLQNKISVLFLGFGLAAGLLLTRERRWLRRRELWLGLGLAGLLFLPYVIWNLRHDWATLEFMRNARAFKMAAVTPLDFLKGQILYNNPAALPVWLAGLFFFFFHPQGRRFRVFGWMYLTIFLVFTVTQGKDYYLAGAYPVLFAGGAVLIAGWLSRAGRRWARPVIAGGLLVPTLLFCPIALPILSVEQTIDYYDRMGLSRESGERHEQGPLPQHFADMHGWEELAALVTAAYRGLTPEERADCLIYTNNYGEAGAIDFFGRRSDLPRAVSGHNNYWIWGPGAWHGTAAIVMGDSRDPEGSRRELEAHFEEVEPAGALNCPLCMPYENGLPLFLCRRARGDIRTVWPLRKHYD